MNYMFRFFVIALISLLGELLNYLIPLPIPASIYGFVIMFVLLLFKVVKVDFVKPVSDFLLNIMPLTFFGPAVAIMTMFSELKVMLLPILMAGTISTAIVMIATGWVSQKMLDKKDKKGDGENE